MIFIFRLFNCPVRYYQAYKRWQYEVYQLIVSNSSTLTTCQSSHCHGDYRPDSLNGFPFTCHSAISMFYCHTLENVLHSFCCFIDLQKNSVKFHFFAKPLVPTHIQDGHSVLLLNHSLRNCTERYKVFYKLRILSLIQNLSSDSSVIDSV